MKPSSHPLDKKAGALHLFTLDVERLEHMIQCTHTDAPEAYAGTDLIAALRHDGYEVYTGSIFTRDIPHTILLMPGNTCIEDPPFRRDFYRQAQSLNLPYLDGDFLTLHDDCVSASSARSLLGNMRRFIEKVSPPASFF